MNHSHDPLRDAKLQPVWHDLSIMPPQQAALTANVECELLIVGGGFTGLWAALQLKEREPKVDIILTEQTFIGDGASGRCGGFLNSSLAHGETNIEARFPEESDRLKNLGNQNLKEYLATLERYGIDVHYEQTGHTDLAMSEDAARELKAEYAQKKASGHNVTWFDKDEIRKQAKSTSFFGGLWDREGLDGVIDPARLCWGLKAVLLGLGVRIYEGTKVTGVKPVGKYGMVAQSEHGAINCGKVLMATNAFTNSINKVNRSIVPVWDYQIATEPLTDAQLQELNWGTPESRHAFSESTNMFHYFRLTKDNRITYGGGNAVRYFFNRGIDKKLIDQPQLYQQLVTEFFSVFPQLKDIKFTHMWGGIIATSTRFCLVPGTTYNGRVAWVVGYTGHGVGASRFGARVGIELLGYQPSDILKMKFLTQKAIPWLPEPVRWLSIRLTQNALIKADNNGGKRGIWLRLLDTLGLGFTC